MARAPRGPAPSMRPWLARVARTKLHGVARQGLLDADLGHPALELPDLLGARDLLDVVDDEPGARLTFGDVAHDRDLVVLRGIVDEHLHQESIELRLGEGYVPSCSTGFWVAKTMKGRSSSVVSPSMVI